MALVDDRLVLAGPEGAEMVWESGESLDQERVNLLRERAASGAGPGTVALTRALPVVPFLVAGGLATAAFGGHLAPPVRALLVDQRMNAATLRLRKEVNGQRRVATEEFRAQTQFTFSRR